MISNELLKKAKNSLKNIEIKDVRIGLSYTGVLLSNDLLGLSYSFAEEKGSCCEIIEESGDLIGEKAIDVAEYINDPFAITASLGLATMNAVFNQWVEEKGDILEFLELRDDDSLGMVGDFRPLVSKLNKDIDLFVFERKPHDYDLYPEYAVEEILPEVDVAIISATTIVNKTIDHLLDLCEDARKVALVGPTTPMAEDVFVSKNVDFLAGSVINDNETALEIISQGGGTRSLKRVSEKVNKRTSS